MSKSFRRAAGPLLMVVALSFTAASAPADELDELLINFDRVQETIRTLSAEFTETTKSMLLTDEIVAQGKLFLTKPDSVRWEYSTPEEMRFVIADDQYTGYFPLRKQAEKRDVNRWGEQLFRFLGIGQRSDELAKFYEIRIDEDGNGDDGTVLLVLDPKKKRVRKRMESVRFWIDSETYLPVRLQYASHNGDSRVIEFDSVSVNPELAASIYVVELPDDVEITKGFSALSGLTQSAN
jgi:outer membrane lipoprotein carrier protein